MTLKEARARVAELDQLIVETVCGMDSDDRLHHAKVHFTDGSVRYLVDVIKEAKQLRADALMPRLRIAGRP